MKPSDPVKYYEDRLQSLAAQEKILLQKKSRLAWFRFLSVVAAFTLAWLLWPAGVAAGIAGFIAGSLVFIYFLKKDWSNNEAIADTKRLQEINEKEIRFLKHHYTDQPEGQRFQDPAHPYTEDLDIFGHASLFQYINRAQSEQGEKELAQWLTEPAIPETIRQRQEAVKELTAMPEWRQQLQSFGRTAAVTHATEEKTNSWILGKNLFLHHRGWQLLRFILPLISLGVLAAWISGVIPSNRFLPASLLLMILAFSISKKVIPIHAQLGRIAAQLDTLSNSIGLIEKAPFQSGWLLRCQENLAHERDTASVRIRRLSRILERMDLRLNFIVFIPLNTFLFWDLQQVFALEKWKENNRQDTGKWFRSLGALEALSGIANLHFNQPSWAFPEFSTADAVFSSKDLGHPLLPSDKRVTSSFETSGKGRLNLVTGSNMAGKSTFLRSIGVNMVLAQAGAPVCATAMTLSPLKVMSSMRISDNLEESTSTFYAELKKLKAILEAVQRKETVFLLLDEILRGTNSADRHAGSAALIRQLIREGAAGVIATHDLELASLATTYPDAIRNYHFDVQVSGEELYFDYRLKEGICQSMNASLLMKKIGIEL